MAALAGSTDRTTTALHVRGVSLRYGRLAALDQVSLSVHAGEIVAVVGENGAGKSTLVRCVAGEIQPDAGRIDLHRAGGDAGLTPPIGVVWQDLGLCDDLDIVANVFLGRERGRLLLAEARMQQEARRVLDRFGSPLADLRTPVDSLSRGERQEVALARAVATGAGLLVLDEPTASLSVMRRTEVVRLLRELRDDGRAILLVSHDLEEAFALADRIVVLRHGRVAASVSPSEVHADDVTALMSGLETESMARRQLNRLKSLVAQLSSAAPAASLPIVLSATAVALDQEMLCVHLRESRPGGPVLRRSGAVGLPPPLLATTGEVLVGTAGGPVGTAVQLAELVTVDDIREELGWSRYLEAAAAAGVRSVWSAPIVGTSGVLGAITGFSAATGRLDPDRAELVSLYAGHAANAIEREQLLDEVSRRNRVLESLRSMLETLAGPDRGDGGLSAALLALCRGLGAGAVGVLRPGEAGSGGDGSARWLVVDLDDSPQEDLVDLAMAAPGEVEQARRAAPGAAVAGLPLSTGQGVLACRWRDPAQPSRDALELLDDARRSLALAIEREGLERARHDAAAARRSQALQRELLQQLSHELRTPLTAIRGYASTLQQPDLTWDAAATERFLAAIATESERMERLVGDLLDSSAIGSGVLRLRRDWTDLRLLLRAAVSCVPERERIDLHIDAGLEPIWADHDRLQQVFVNLLENAVRHGRPGGRVAALARPAAAGTVEVLVRDDGPGVPAGIAGQVFEPRVRGEGSGGAGLGLAIARGVAEAHGGTCELLDGPVTTFRVALPVEPADSEPPGEAGAAPEPAATVTEEGWGPDG